MLLAPLLALALVPSSDPVRDEGWRSDLEHFAQEARRSHADPRRPAHSEAFAAAVAALHRDVPELNDDEVLARMMELAAFLNDGHTALYGPGPDSPLPFERGSLPLRFHLFDEGLFVVGAEGEHVEHVGSRVLRFGKLEPEEVLERMSVYRGVDNAMTWKWLGPQHYVAQVWLLRIVGAAPRRGPVEVVLRGRDGGEHTLSLEPGDHGHAGKLGPFPGGAPPLWLADVDTPYRIVSLPEHEALYVPFNQVRDAPGESLADFAERLRARLADGGATLLVVDVRHNNGGNNTLLRPLVRALIEFEMRSPDHRIAVLTGRGTFSAAQNFVNRVERWTNAVFIGEPSSSRPNFVGEENRITLPFSRVVGSISDLYWQDSEPWDDRPWIEPHVRVETTAADWIAGRDSVLERALER